MKKHVMLILLAVVLASSSFAQKMADVPENTVDTLKILAVGNSFSVDGLTYLQEIAQAAGRPVIIGNLYIGGCSLERHYQNSLTDDKPYIYYKNVCGNKTEEKYSLLEGITDEQWDVVSFQQASHFSGMYETYYPYLSELKNFVAKNVKKPNVRYAWHMTWAYSSDSDHGGFSNYHNNQQRMQGAIEEVSAKVFQESKLDIFIPSGKAIDYCRKSKLGDHLTRDGYHLNDVGRFAAGCTWYIALFGDEVKGNSYKPETITQEQAAIAREAAEKGMGRM